MLDNTNKSKFNMSQLILETINNMKQVAATKNRTGNISGWYFEWKNIKLEIIGN